MQNLKEIIGTWGLKIAGFVILTLQILKYYHNELVLSWGNFLVFLLSALLILKPRYILTLINKFISNKFKTK